MMTGDMTPRSGGRGFGVTYALPEKGSKSPKDHPMINSVLDALETAVGYSTANIPQLPGTTLIACDVSGSMERPVSAKSTIERFDIGIILGMLARTRLPGSSEMSGR
jgi:hypothetical protein